MSTCNISKAQGDKWLLCGNGSLFCLAKGQTVHTWLSLQEWETLGTISERKDILEKEGWPSLQCQIWTLFSMCFTELRLYRKDCKFVVEVWAATCLEFKRDPKCREHSAVYPYQSSSNAWGPVWNSKLIERRCNNAEIW